MPEFASELLRTLVRFAGLPMRPDGARYIAPPSEGMCSRPGTVI